MINLSKIAERLDELMFDSNLDSKNLAQQLGVDGSTISRYRSGERIPTVKNLILLADYFNCSTDYLLGIENETTVNNFKPCPPFSERFKELLNQKGYNCFSFSNAANIHQSRVYAWHSGKRIPSLDNVIKIAEFLGCSIDYVLGRES